MKAQAYEITRIEELHGSNWRNYRDEITERAYLGQQRPQEIADALSIAPNVVRKVLQLEEGE